MPTLPSAAPAASSAAASRPRRLPSSPARCFRADSCFSIRVALAQKIAGSARNSPPIEGPKARLTSPVATVANPPKAKRTRYSCHCTSLSDERERRTSITRLRRQEGEGKKRRPATAQKQEALPEAQLCARASRAGKPRRYKLQERAHPASSRGFERPHSCCRVGRGRCRGLQAQPKARRQRGLQSSLAAAHRPALRKSKRRPRRGRTVPHIRPCFTL